MLRDLNEETLNVTRKSNLTCNLVHKPLSSTLNIDCFSYSKVSLLVVTTGYPLIDKSLNSHLNRPLGKLDAVKCGKCEIMLTLTWRWPIRDKSTVKSKR